VKGVAEVTLNTSKIVLQKLTETMFAKHGCGLAGSCSTVQWIQNATNIWLHFHLLSSSIVLCLATT